MGSGAFPALPHKGQTVVSLAAAEPQGGGDGTGPGRDRKNGTGPGQGNFPGKGPAKNLPPSPIPRKYRITVADIVAAGPLLSWKMGALASAGAPPDHPTFSCAGGRPNAAGQRRRQRQHPPGVQTSRVPPPQPALSQRPGRTQRAPGRPQVQDEHDPSTIGRHRLGHDMRRYLNR
jgi:hypothetical protein